MIDRKLCILLIILLFVVLWGCAPSRTYSTGIMSEDIGKMTAPELEKYDARLTAEIQSVQKGGPVPAGMSSEAYLNDLKRRQNKVHKKLGLDKVPWDMTDFFDEDDRSY